MTKNKGGRPTVLTPKTIMALEEAFKNGATDLEAIFLANISSSTFYKYCQENQEFSERKESLKEMVKYRARQNIVKAINDGDKPLSQWYLERKAKSEFSQRSELTGADGKELPQPIVNLNVLGNDSTDKDSKAT